MNDTHLKLESETGTPGAPLDSNAGPHLTEGEIFDLAFGEASFFVTRRAEAHLRRCAACRDSIRSLKEAAAAAERAVPVAPEPWWASGNIVPFGTRRGPGSVPAPGYALLAADTTPAPAPPPEQTFADLNSAFTAAMADGRGARFIASLFAPRERLWFRACHALAHAKPAQNCCPRGECCRPLREALVILPLRQRQVAELHLDLARALRDGALSTASPDADVATSVAESELPLPLARDILCELATEPALLRREIAASAQTGKLWHGNLRSSYKDAEVAVVLVEKQEGRKDTGVVAFLTLEIVVREEGKDRKVTLYPIPATALCYATDDSFRDAEKAAEAYAMARLEENAAFEVRWRLDRESAEPEPTAVSGGSLGLAFAFLLRRLTVPEGHPIALVDLDRVAFTGVVTATGEIHPVSSAVEKALTREFFHTLVAPNQELSHPALRELRDPPGTERTPENPMVPYTTADGTVHILRVKHVEGVAVALDLDRKARSCEFDFSLPPEQKDFVGRKGALDALLRFVKGRRSGYGVVVGGMGVGKSSLLRQFVRQLAATGRRPAFHFVPSQPEGTSRRETLARAIELQLRSSHLIPDPSSTGMLGVEDRLRKLLLDISRANSESDHVDVIVIDAVNQVEMPLGQSVVPDLLPAELPPGIVCVISSVRTPEALSDRRGGAEYFVIGDDLQDIPSLTDDRKDVGEYLKKYAGRELNEKLIADITTQKDKLPVFLTVVKRLAELRPLPPDSKERAELLDQPELWLTPSKDFITSRICYIIVRPMTPDRSDERKVWEAFGMLALAREPVSEDVLRGLNLWEEPIGMILKRASEFFVPVRSEPRRPSDPYVFDHQGLPSIIQEKLGDAWGTQFHRRIAMNWENWDDLRGAARTYALLHLPAHLRRAEMWDELYQILTDFKYLRARIALGRPAGTPAPGVAGGTGPSADQPQDEMAWKIAGKVLGDIERALHGEPAVPLDHKWRRSLEALHRSIEAHTLLLHEDPWVLVQELYNDLIHEWEGRDLGTKLRAAVGSSTRTMLIRTEPPPRYVRNQRLQRHRSDVRSVAISPDERHVASASEDGTAIIWKIRNHECRVLGPHGGPVTSVAWNHDGTVLASLAGDVRLWNPKTAALLGTLPARAGAVLAFAPKAPDLLAVAGMDGSLRLFSVSEKKEIAVLREHGPGVRCMAFSSDGALLVIGTGDEQHHSGTVELFDVSQRTHLRSFPPLPSWAEGVKILPGDRTIAVSGGLNIGELRFYSIDGGPAQRTLRLNPSGIFGLAACTKGLLATGAEDRIVRLYDLESMQAIPMDMAHTDVVRTVALAPSGKFLVSGGRDQSVMIWWIDLLARPSAAGMPGDGAHGDIIHASRYSRDGQHLASASRESTARLYQMLSGTPERVFATGGKSAHIAVLSPDGGRLAVGSHVALRLFEAGTGNCLHTLAGHEGWILDAAWTPDGTRIVSVADDARAIVWDARTGACITAHTAHTSRLRAVAISPDSRFAATAGDEARIHIWDLVDGKLIHTLHGHERRIKALAWSPCGLLASAGSDDFAKVWDPLSGREHQTLCGLSQEVWSLCFGPDQLLAVGGKDGMARLFDLRDPQAPAAVLQCPDAIQAFWFSHDGTELQIAEAGGARHIPSTHRVRIVRGVNP